MMDTLIERLKEGKDHPEWGSLNYDVWIAFFEFWGGSTSSIPNIKESVDDAILLAEKVMPGRGDDCIRKALKQQNFRHSRHMRRHPIDNSELARDIVIALIGIYQDSRS